MRKKHAINLISVVLLAVIIASFPILGCGGAPSQSTESITDRAEPQASGKSETNKPEDPGTRYEIPEFREAVFSEESAEGNEEALIDISHINEGYFGVLTDSDTRLKLQVLKGEKTFTYDLFRGKVDFFPLQDGDGEYYVRVMKNLEDTKYFELYSVTFDAVIDDEFSPYLHPNQYADYSKGSECVEFAADMAEESYDVHNYIHRVYDYVSGNVEYDYDKANSDRKGYVPEPDETLKTGRGICIDYAALTAAMLRSQGVPCKVIFGYVSPNDVYHAWNMFYTEDEGWITVEFKVDPRKWNRLDLTFVATGADDTFIGDGNNYTDIYQY